MIIELNVPEYNGERGMVYSWEEGFVIKTELIENQIVINANKEGLISLATQLLFLAQNETPIGHHFHFDDYNSLEIGSKELVIAKI